MLVAVIKTTDEVIGDCKLHAPDKDGIAATDVKLLPVYWGHKYGVEIKHGLLDYLFTNTDCSVIQATSLEEIDIKPSHGRQGLGKALINAICNWAKTVGFNEISLSTFRDIPWNAPYYEQLGFRIVPESEFTKCFFEIREAEEELGLSIDQRVIMSKHF